MQREKHITHADKDNPAQWPPHLQGPGAQANLSPLVDRLGTPEGRACALKALDAPTEGDEDEQRDTVALLARAAWESPLAPRETNLSQTKRAE